MRRLATFAVVALAALLVTSCGTSSTTSYCPDLSTDTLLPEPLVTGGLWDVTYTVGATGGAPVTSIQYRNAAGTLVTVTNPALPWTFGATEMRQLAPGTRVTLSASAIAPPGTVSVSVLAVSNTTGGHEERHWNDSCGDLPMQ